MVSRTSYEHLVGQFNIYHEYTPVFFARIVAVGNSNFCDMLMTRTVSDKSVIRMMFARSLLSLDVRMCTLTKFM